MPKLSKAQRKLYDKLHRQHPVSKDIKFKDVEKLLLALGCSRTKKGGANIVFRYGVKTWAMHKPHPDSGLYEPYIKQIRAFIAAAGLTVEEDTDDESN